MIILTVSATLHEKHIQGYIREYSHDRTA